MPSQQNSFQYPRRSILLELDMGVIPGTPAMDTGAHVNDILNRINPIQVIVDYWEDISDACIEAIVSSGINYDANVFYEGAVEGFEDRVNIEEYDPDEGPRHNVMFQKNLDYIMGYHWGYGHQSDWDGEEIPQSVMKDFIELQIEEYKQKTKTEITKDILFTAYDNISPNRILRKAYYPIKDAYKEDGWKGAIKKGLPLATTIAVVEALDQVVIPLICIKFGLPPLTNAVGLGELIYPVVLPKLGGKESMDFVQQYKETSGNEEIHDDFVIENRTGRYVPHTQRPTLLTEGLNLRDIFVDVVQVGLDSGAIAVSGGAGGDVLVDVFVAAQEAEQIYSEVQKIFMEVKSLALIIKKCLTYDLSKGLDGYYKLVQKTAKDLVKNGIVGQSGVDWLNELREEVENMINRVVRAVSKWVGALIPDDFGLGSIGFESTITTALNQIAEESYDYAQSALDSLPLEASDLLLDERALQDFLEDCASGLKVFVADLVDRVENPDPDKAGLWSMFWSNLKLQGEMTVAPLTGLVNIGSNLMGKEDVFDSVMDDYLDTLETLPSWHPTRKVLAWGLPKVEETLDSIEQNHCGLAARTLGYLMKVLMGGIALLQTSYDEEFIKKLEKIKPNSIGLDFELTDADLDLKDENLLENRKMRITESKLRQIISKVITEAGENDAQLRQALRNRERMIGIGMDAGTMPFNPSWDYDKKPSSGRSKKVMGQLRQVAERLEQHEMGEWCEATAGYHSNQMKIKSGDMVVEVKYMAGRGEYDYVFNMVAPAKWRNRWSESCDSIDNDIDAVLDSLNDWIMQKEMEEMGEG